MQYHEVINQAENQDMNLLPSLTFQCIQLDVIK